MKSTIERTYSLGQYQNIKIQNEIVISDNISDEEQRLLRVNQLIDMEFVYMDYIKLVKDIEHLDFGEILDYLENKKKEVYEMMAIYSTISEEENKEEK